MQLFLRVQLINITIVCKTESQLLKSQAQDGRDSTKSSFIPQILQHQRVQSYLSSYHGIHVQNICNSWLKVCCGIIALPNIKKLELGCIHKGKVKQHNHN
jgi:hypothetical protein